MVKKMKNLFKEGNFMLMVMTQTRLIGSRKLVGTTHVLYIENNK